MAGNKQNYTTSEGCSISGLSVGCPVGGSDGWYSDGTNSYYVTSGLVTSVNTDPCYVAPPPPPPPPSSSWIEITLYKRSNTAFGACAFAANLVAPTSYWIDTYSISTASVIATAADGSGRPPNGYYSDGSESIYVSGGAISDNAFCA